MDKPREVKESSALREMLSGTLRRERYYYVGSSVSQATKLAEVPQKEIPRAELNLDLIKSTT